MPALLYAATVILHTLKAHRIPTEHGHIKLVRWETPAVTMALIWLAYEFVILIGPAELRTAQYFVLESLAVGLVVSIGQLILDPGALRVASEPESAAPIK
jgi:energy-converting hydrogenase Eha subunit E